MSAESALIKHHQKLFDLERRRQKRGSKKNAKPEKVLEKQILEWALRRGFSLHVIEAKAVYSTAAGRYLRGQAEAGLPDLIGNFGSLSVWVELKSKGRMGTLKEHQREFLVRKIEQECFAVCVDSVELLSEVFQAFISSVDKIKLLLNALPQRRAKKQRNEDQPLF